ncbi:hypothetical protein HDE_04072 [Halotydeus destructor]|nr:hypothetical protein HDE_04072 [Halotydeus destructor]
MRSRGENESVMAVRTKSKSNLSLRLIVRSVLVVACLCCCTFFLYRRVVKYFKYETNVSVQVVFMKELRKILPGITVCSNIWISLFNLQKGFKDLQRDMSAITKQNVTEEAKYVLTNKLLKSQTAKLFSDLPLPMHFNLSGYRKLPKKVALTSGKQLLESIECDRKTWQAGDGKYEAYSLPDICYNVHKVRTVEKAGVCFTLFHEASLIAMLKGEKLHTNRNFSDFTIGKDLERQVNEEAMDAVGLGSTWNSFTHIFAENTLLTLEVNYNLEPTRRPNQSTALDVPYGGKFWVHSNRIIPKMSTLGFELFPGRKYTLYIQKETTIRMQPPYKTACKDYEQEYRNLLAHNVTLDLQVPLSQEACVDECIGNEAVRNVQLCGCWPSVLPFRKHNNSLDRMNIKWCADNVDCYSIFEKRCRKNCPNDCKEEYYEILIKEVPEPNELKMQKRFDETPESKWDRIYRSYNPYQPTTKIQVVFRTSEESVYIHEPAHELISLLVEVAGLLGLFLGLSVVYTFDVYEMIRNHFTKLRFSNRRVWFFRCLTIIVMNSSIRDYLACLSPAAIVKRFSRTAPSPAKSDDSKYSNSLSISEPPSDRSDVEEDVQEQPSISESALRAEKIAVVPIKRLRSTMKDDVSESKVKCRKPAPKSVKIKNKDLNSSVTRKRRLTFDVACEKPEVIPVKSVQKPAPKSVKSRRSLYLFKGKVKPVDLDTPVDAVIEEKPCSLEGNNDAAEIAETSTMRLDQPSKHASSESEAIDDSDSSESVTAKCISEKTNSNSKQEKEETDTDDSDSSESVAVNRIQEETITDLKDKKEESDTEDSEAVASYVNSPIKLKKCKKVDGDGLVPVKIKRGTRKKAKKPVTETTSPRVKLKLVKIPPCKNPYSFDEDYAILNYIVKSKKYSELKGNTFWKLAEREKLCGKRSYQSMKERFRRRIFPIIHTYGRLDRKERDMIHNAYVECKAKEKKPKNKPKAVVALKKEELDAEDESGSSDDDDEDNADEKNPTKHPYIDFLKKSKKSKNMSPKIPIKFFTQEDDMRLINAVLHAAKHQTIHVHGNSLWKEIAGDDTISQNRTFHSLRERFIKRILPHLDTYY